MSSKNNVTFLINKSEFTAGTRGASLGPDAIITAARKRGSFIFGENTIDKIQNVNSFLDKQTNKSSLRRQVDALLDTFDDREMRIIEGTAKAICKAKEPEE